jgi:outer membrane receptor for ferrienterochelin and colicin
MTPTRSLLAGAFALAVLPGVAWSQDKAAPAGQATTTVTVTGKRAEVVNKVDRKVYRVDKDLQGTTGSAGDVLRNVPSVEVDTDGNISLRGDSSVTVLIDGKPSARMQGAGRGDALLSLPAGEIEQIEVISAPSAEFKPDGSGGIINIVTKKHAPGRSGTLTAFAGNDGRYNLNASGTWVHGPLSLGAGAGLREDDRRRTIDGDSTTTDGTENVTRTVEHATEHMRRLNTTGNVNLGYTPNDRQSFTLAADTALRNDVRHGPDDNVLSGASMASYDRAEQGREHHIDGVAVATFVQKFATPGESLKLTLQGSQSLERQHYDYVTTYPGGVPAPSLEALRILWVEDVQELGADYVRPLGTAATLKLGYDYQYDSDRFDDDLANAVPPTAAPVVDPAKTSLFRYRQTISASYISYDRKAGPLEVLGGLRFEHVDIRTLQQIGHATGGQAYNRVYPTLNAAWTLSDADTLSGGLSNRVARPDPEDLNPYIDPSNPHMLRQGNPALKPAETTSWQVGYRHEAGGSRYELNAYAKKTLNGEGDLTRVLSGDVVLVTHENLFSSHANGLEFIASGRLLPKLSYSLSSNLFEQQIDARSLGAPGLKSTTVLNAKGSLDYAPTSKDRLQLSLNRNGKRLTAQGYVLPVTTVNAGYRHQLHGDLALVATVSDLFDGQRFRRVFDTPAFAGAYERRQAGRVVFAGLSWTFGGAKKAKDAGFSYDQGN